MEIHQVKIIEAARGLGIGVTDLSRSWGMDAISLEWKGQREIVIQGRIFRYLSAQADLIAANKHAGKQLMKAAGIPVPVGLTFEDAVADNEAISQFTAKYQPVVCKPLDGTEGLCILMDITDPDDVVAHWRAVRGQYAVFLLEQQVSGTDLRIQSIGGVLVAACTRIPTRILGDGQHSVRELIDRKNRALAALNPENQITIDHQVRDLLARRQLHPDSIIPAGQEIGIKKVANMSQGARAVDITDEIHSTYYQWVERISESLNLSLFSLDVITVDHRKDPSRHAKALEINAQPAWLHHTFSERRRHDIPTLILRHLFGIS